MSELITIVATALATWALTTVWFKTRPAPGRSYGLTARDVEHWFKTEAAARGDYLSKKQVREMRRYAQMWNEALYGEPLYPED